MCFSVVLGVEDGRTKPKTLYLALMLKQTHNKRLSVQLEVAPMELKSVLQNADLFEGFSDEEFDKIARICSEKRFRKGELIAKEGEAGEEFFIITEGFVEVVIGERPSKTARVVVSLGSGQIIGEMSLVDQGPRSASLRATSEPTIVQVIRHKDLDDLAQEEPSIGYKVMRNLAADLSFKLRHSNLMKDR